MRRYEELGGNKRIKKVDSFSNISDEYSLIVNCTGLESRALVNDDEVYPVLW